jgi:DNA-binding GntR family transcriptional regulator
MGTLPLTAEKHAETATKQSLAKRDAQSTGRRRRHGGLTNEAYSALRELIFSGQLLPSDRLVETDLAERLNVSRTPVREALQKLCSEGLVVEAPKKGYAVAALSPEYVLDHYAVREVLEGLAARLAASTSSEMEVVQLGALLDAMERANKGNRIDELAQHNASFYLLIAKASRNVVLVDLLTLLQDRLRMLRDFNLRVTGRRTEALKDQRRLVNAITARDPEKSERLAKSLVANARQARLAALRKGR